MSPPRRPRLRLGRRAAAAARALGAAACALLLRASLSGAAAPNVLLLLSDSFDGRLLAGGSPESAMVALPALRALAARGASFEGAYTNSPVCGPSRAVMLTSRHVHESGVFNNYQELPRDTFTGGLDAGCLASYGAAQCAAWAAQFPINVTLFNAFEEAGYEMAVYGKIDIGAGTAQRYSNSTGGSDHGGPEPRCVLRAADLPLDTMGRPSSSTGNNAGPSPDDAVLAGEAAAWLRARGAAARAGRAGAGAPFFLQLSIGLPHFPFVTGPEWLAAVNDSAVGPNPEWPPIEDMHPYDAHMVYSKGCAYDFTSAEVLQLRRVYLAMAAQADALHGEVLAALDASGLAGETIVLFSSDHGEMAFDMRQVYKNSWREPSARVPLIVAGPGVPAGARVATPVSLIDLWPTLAELAGVASAPGARGHSLAPLMRGDAGAAAAAASVPVIGEYFAENSNTGAFMVRLGDLKLVAFGTAFPWFAGYAPQLFNVTEDPHETRDISAQRPDLVTALEAELTAAVGDYQAVDAAVKANDLFVFRAFLTSGKNASEVRRMLENNFANFSDASWARVLEWNASSAGAGGAGGR